MGRAAAPVPERIAWAVDLLDPRPAERILEVGCGPGVALGLVGRRLNGGLVVGIDRSATAAERSRRRNEALVDAGRVELRRVDLAGFRGDDVGFDKAFAVNVNAFWTGPARAEAAVLARVLRPGGRLWLVYGGPGPDRARDVGSAVAASLAMHGFEADVVRHPDGSMLCVAARLPAGPAAAAPRRRALSSRAGG